MQLSERLCEKDAIRSRYWKYRQANDIIGASKASSQEETSSSSAPAPPATDS